MKTKNRKKRRFKKLKPVACMGVTWGELIENNANLMNDAEAQKIWAKELDEQGFFISFAGPFPSIGAKKIHVTTLLSNL